MTLAQGLNRDIKILEKDLKDEADLKKILKLRLTKKEYKVFLFKNEDASDNIMKEKLLLDNKRLEDVKEALLKKLNYEKLKQELTQG